MISVARVLLRSQTSRIVVMDEPTANIDVRSDEIIQRVIRERLCNKSVDGGATLLTIAHRLQTEKKNTLTNDRDSW